MSFEDHLEQHMFTSSGEKTFIDKVLARDEVNKIQELIKKDKLTRSELLEVLYLISGTEAKLLNYSEWDRYVILKFFVWIREFIKIAELLYDYHDILQKKVKKGKFKLSNRAKQLLENNSNLIQHNAKFLIDLYLNISRTSMSLGMSSFLEIMRNKYEVHYPALNQAQMQGQTQGGIFKGLIGGGK